MHNPTPEQTFENLIPHNARLNRDIDQLSRSERENLHGSKYMSLNSVCKSPEAIKLAEVLALGVWQKTANRSGGPGIKLAEAVGAIIADILKADADEPGSLCYRSMATGSFSGMAVGYHVFKRALDGLQYGQYLRIIKSKPGLQRPGEKTLATRVGASESLLKVAATFGIHPDDYSVNFADRDRPKTYHTPVIVRASSTRKGADKVQGKPIKYDLSGPMGSYMKDQVDRINDYMAGQRIENAVHFAFQRIFNQGDRVDFSLDKGGRLYSLGADSFQNMKKERRPNILINGHRVVEIDVTASHLTILHSLLGLAFDPAAADPYAMAIAPRSIIKSWIVMTLGHERYHRSWPKEIKEAYRATDVKALQRDHPIRSIENAVLEKFPALRGWESSKIRWGDLQFLESQAVIGAVETLASQHDIPALPVHDSIIVPTHAESRAKQVLSDQFLCHVGVRPALVAKGGRP